MGMTREQEKMRSTERCTEARGVADFLFQAAFWGMGGDLRGSEGMGERHGDHVDSVW